jgi:hypothetical protein
MTLVVSPFVVRCHLFTRADCVWMWKPYPLMLVEPFCCPQVGALRLCQHAPAGGGTQHLGPLRGREVDRAVKPLAPAVVRE